MSVKIYKIFLDGSWCEIPYDELKDYDFEEMIVQEIMTKEEYAKIYFGMENTK